MNDDGRIQRREFIRLVGIAGMGLAAACAPSAAPATPAPTKAPASAAAAPTQAAPTLTPVPPTPKPATVHVGGLPGSVADGPFHIGIAKGYYKEQGLTVQMDYFQSAALMIAPLASGDLDVGAGTISAALFNAIDRGVALKIVATKGSIVEGFSSAWVVVRKDLIDSGQVKEVKDLKGKRIAMTALKGGAEAIVARMLKQSGLSIKDVEILGMTTPDMVISFSNKAIDAALMMESALTTAVEQGLAVRWPPGAPYAMYGGKWYNAVLIASEPFTKNVDVARRFMVGYIKSLREYYDAFVKGKNRSEIVSIISKAIDVDPALFDKMGLPYMDPDGSLTVPSMKIDFDYFKEMGYYEGKLEIEPQIDTQFIEYAVKQLGPHT
ncbi:MAG: ABC transporter substrate-binding protein [Dehalococcoidia bacterium]|nr:ABC transporter substrate-binding protein [Dehalococcoidia bacterium]